MIPTEMTIYVEGMKGTMSVELEIALTCEAANRLCDMCRLRDENAECAVHECMPHDGWWYHNAWKRGELTE